MINREINPLPFTGVCGPSSRRLTEVLDYCLIYPCNVFENKFFKFATWTYVCDKLGDILRVKAGTELVEIFKKIKIISGGNLSLSFIHKIKIFNSRLRLIQQTRGRKGLILYLKASSVCLQQSVSGHRLPDSMPLGVRVSRTRSGIPRIIPAQHRIFMVNRGFGYTVLIRYYLTLFSLYRVLPLAGVPKLNTITDSGVYFDLNRFTTRIDRFLKLFVKDETRRLIPRFYLSKYFKTFPIYKASPSTRLSRTIPLDNPVTGSLWSTHPLALLESVASLVTHPIPFGIIKGFSEVFAPKLLFLFKQLSGVTPLLEGSIGKLSFKEEAAGKVRVFALVDPITQWLLAPLHKYLFAILRRIPMDGTFNQLRPV